MSRDHHLSIHIDTTRRQRLPEDDPSGGPSDPLHNFRPIAAASKRWSSAAFELVGARELQLFLSWISDPPEQLRTLSIFVLSGAISVRETLCIRPFSSTCLNTCRPRKSIPAQHCPISLATSGT